MKIIIPISIGELLDKISILQIKSQYTNNPYVLKELQDLIKIAKENKVNDSEYLECLLEVNKKLWNIENELRTFEQEHIFNDDFVSAARLVYTYNDKRATIKKEINQKYDSDYQEVKLYH